MDLAAVQALFQTLGPAGIIGAILFWILQKRDTEIAELRTELRTSQEARISSAERMATIIAEGSSNTLRLTGAIERATEAMSEVGELIRVQNEVQKQRGGP